MMKKHIIALAAIALTLCSCGEKNEFKVDGKIDGADEKTLLLETVVNGVWIPIDSTKTESDGEFSLSRKAPRWPEIYRLTYQEKSIYFPIDSLEQISIHSNAKTFDTNYTLAGSNDAKLVMEIDKKALTLSGANVKESVVKKEAFKRELAEKILQHPQGIVAYYIINKYVNGAPLFDPQNSVDLRIIGAVANAYNSYRPNDPRTAYLVKTLLDGQRERRAAIAKADTIHANVARILDIDLQDKTGKVRHLNDVTSKGNVVLLNFTAYSAKESPAFNNSLLALYNANRAKGFEIYQVGLDDNIAQWKSAANNLPWITVYDPAGVNSNYIRAYNVGALPAIFIINRKGELSERVLDLSKLESTLNKYIK